MRAVQIGMERNNAHPAAGRLVERRAALGTHRTGRAKRLGRLDVDGMMREQHVSTGLQGEVHVGPGGVECAGHAADLVIGVAYG